MVVLPDGLLEQGLCAVQAHFHVAFRQLQGACHVGHAQAEAQLSAVDWPQYDDVLFLSKSIGTAVSAAFAQRHGIPCRQILYTPLSLTFALAPQNALAFLGTADPWSDAFSVAAAARANGTPLCLYENANHSLETGDVLHDLATLQDVMQKTQTFIADTPH